jgi:hypothetical protein
MPRYLAYRRLNPYRGVVQVVETEAATAHSHDGITWHLRADDGYGWVRPTGIWVEGQGLQAGAVQQHEALLAALEQRPPLPFPLADVLELWLLDKASGLPLALLEARREAAGPDRGSGGLDVMHWHPFVASYTGFRSAALAARGGRGDNPAAHREYLTHQVNQAARPLLAAQWFRRHEDGSGEGLHGQRLPAEWASRSLPVEAFPELLLRREWNNQLEQSVIKDYHAWLAALLLLLPGIAGATRRWLETEACLRPQALARVHRLLPAQLDAEAIKAALVAARLEQSAAPHPEHDLY